MNINYVVPQGKIEISGNNHALAELNFLVFKFSCDT